MANSPTPPNLIRGTNNTGNGTVSAGITPSRLLINTNALRNDLVTRNLYTPTNSYPSSAKNQAQNIINAVNGISSIITPFKSYNLKNTVYGRLLNPAEATPLTEIGLAMLGKQFAMNSGSHIAQQNFPVIKVSNLFDGNKKTKLFTKNIDLKITKKESATNFQNFLDAVVYYYPMKDYPFTKNPSNADFIENSGTGQLSFLFRAMNQNIYKQGWGNTPNDTTLMKHSVKTNTDLTLRYTITDAPNSNYKKYFNFLLNSSSPYVNIKTTEDSIITANQNVVYGLNNSKGSVTEEYAPNSEFVRLNFGQTNKNNTGNQLSDVENIWVNEGDEFGDSSANKIIWGRDSVTKIFNSDSVGTIGDVEDKLSTTNKLSETFNVRSGLLDYTRNLLNASEGNIIDQTRKAFKKGQDIIGFNGSNLWVVNGGKYAGENNGKTGLRQHSALDPYNRFAKTIRFNGNNVYGGNENSVIYDRVLPRIHPTTPLDSSGVPNNKNLMFSLENLAIRVISKDGVGIIDDEFGSAIPVSEVGPFNGRQMWFSPYGMELNESTQAKFESTVMVGRNEPMYNYMNSERSATLSFMLIIDYPPQLKNYRGSDKHKKVAEFFAFGGNDYNPEPIPNNPPKKYTKNTIHIDTITGPIDTAEPDEKPSPAISISFPNDFPKEKDVNTAFDTMYKTNQYEIVPGCKSADGLISEFGINKNVYFVTGLTGKAEEKTLKLTSFSGSQYTQSGITGQDGSECLLNKELKRIFENTANRHYYDVVIKGGASKLYTEQNPNDIKEEKDYNKKLGLRRARATKKLIEERIKVLFGDYPEKLGINIIFEESSEGTTGSDLANQSNATKAAINNNATKEERYAEINIRRNSIIPIKKVPLLSPVDITTINLLGKDNNGLAKMESQSGRNANQDIMQERKGDVQSDGGDGAILSGFQSVEGNYYYPAFHSQTPEDFHRRLTFLQQCMRQGAAKRYDTVNDNGILRARNSVFGRQPICILRVGDFFYTKVIIDNLTIDYTDTTWDMNPEGFGMQPMIAKVTLQMKVMGGQSLKGPIDALQNAVTFNHYANSNFTNKGMYARPAEEATNQDLYMNGVDGKSGLLGEERGRLTDEYKKKFPPKS